jgi:hypothetical protein
MISQRANLDEALNSMLRTDYIALSDTGKLSLLADYYVDIGNYVSQMVQPIDQLIVGRRGTGKTTLLYRALVECSRSWKAKSASAAMPRTLGIYLDLVKCQSLSSALDSDYDHFEHAFVSELRDAIRDELHRSWPALSKVPNLVDRVFRSNQSKMVNAVNAELEQLAEILRSGVPRLVDASGGVEIQDKKKSSAADKKSVSLKVGKADGEISGQHLQDSSRTEELAMKYTEKITYRLTIADLLRVIGNLRNAADIPYFIIFIDEFSSLDEVLQRRFSTLLKKILGNHAGVYVKICAITDHFHLGSSIILQRDLFELSLDFDSFVERSGSLGEAMEHLVDVTRNIVSSRLKAYGVLPPESLFRDPNGAYRELAYSSMGVPRTLGIVLKQSWMRASATTNRAIGARDIEYGVRYASKAYLNQMMGAAQDHAAIPEHVIELWDSLLARAGEQRTRGRSKAGAASHFMILPKFEPRLKFLNMFFLLHLLEQGRTTKKEGYSRSLYCFDYGVARENNLGWNDDKDTIRQQRFAYDDVLERFDRFYGKAEDEEFTCPNCGSSYRKSELVVSGIQLDFCPRDRTTLAANSLAQLPHDFTEEEIKIIGAIRSARREDSLVARQVADDVGCYVQKVAKFGEKLDKEGLISRVRPPGSDRNIYFREEHTSS